MHIVFFSHPLFLGSQSMPRFTNMLADGMKDRGHTVEIWRPEPIMYNFKIPKLKKWLGYLDQYILFPLQVRRRILKMPKNTLYVVTDHALGPYVPLISDKPHVIHCHDFLAQRSALGQIPENVTSSSGKKYQGFIRRGYSKGKYFISVSKKTKEDLENFLPHKPLISEMVYNGLNPGFKLHPADEGREKLGGQFKLDLTEGYILHVGGNQWYKNRVGVISIYNKWRSSPHNKMPLLLIGERPSTKIVEQYNSSPYKQDIHFLSGLNDETVWLAYSCASVFLFPSLAEGFGWPIAEGMASGTIVITTNENPMLEVAGDAAYLIDRMPIEKEHENIWSDKAAIVVEEIITLNEELRSAAIEKGLENIAKFNLEDSLDKIENIYKEVLHIN